MTQQIQYDQLNRFLFESSQVRGEITQLDKSYKQAIASHDYPPIVNQLIGQAMAAASLLSATIKFEGQLILQFQGQGNLRILAAECTSDGKVRAVARYQDMPKKGKLIDLLGKGQAVITLQPEKGEPWQGLVPLEKPDMAKCLEDYFQRSEQLPTHIQLACDGEIAAGFMLQAMPESANNARAADVTTEESDLWNTVVALAATLKKEELLHLPESVILHRLFHEYGVRLFDPKPIQFSCRCSKERLAVSLSAMSETDLDEIQDEKGQIHANCEYCNQTYSFDVTSLKAAK
ncbi:Hsp33 family molecular chaperone HslO [Pelagibaculum spongiae]|uniref:Hsp33 family molecular chaperone HslO n=1 Tax=Pelagibaculum spongiae TaxID=2080658 RepID=A0A2V1GY74_9GAMM|nr:Hsp33 family molecular chaperone HslO [Pelagibaculum spongiae]PVZ67614.1 Hsp33 family molecular chaperone HslO [Pelagibaculum spongiae]